MPRGVRPCTRNSHTPTNARWIGSAFTMLHSKSKDAALKSKNKGAALKSKSKSAALKSKSKSAVCATNRYAQNVSAANGKFLSAPPRARPRNSGDKAPSIKPSPRLRRGSGRSIRSVQLKVREKAHDLGTSMHSALRHRRSASRRHRYRSRLNRRSGELSRRRGRRSRRGCLLLGRRAGVRAAQRRRRMPRRSLRAPHQRRRAPHLTLRALRLSHRSISAACKNNCAR